MPFVQGPESIFFGDFRGRLFEDSVQEGNLALGYRAMLDIGWNAGAWIGFDIRNTSLNNTFTQISVGIELLHPDGGFRLNGYLPLDDTELVGSSTIATTTTTGGGVGGPPTLQLLGNQLFLVTPGGTITNTITSATTSELALYGVDAEIEYRVPLEKIFGGKNGVDSDTFRNELRLYPGRIISTMLIYRAK